MAILDPRTAIQLSPVAVTEKSNRKPCQLKVYKNPRSDEFVETRGGNHKILKEWKSQYGAEEVEGWLIK